ncbi:hypothetical protein DSUL_20548 [Desulfovibrionales bacterium]
MLTCLRASRSSLSCFDSNRLKLSVVRFCIIEKCRRHMAFVFGYLERYAIVIPLILIVSVWLPICKRPGFRPRFVLFVACD